MTQRLGAVCFLLLLGALISSGGCGGDRCVEGTTRCRANVAEHCFRYQSHANDYLADWVSEDCGSDHCQLPPDGEATWPFCSLEQTPDPAMPAELSELPYAEACIGSSVVRWRYGFRVEEIACSSEHECIDGTDPDFGEVCGGSASCRPTAGRDPRCGASVFSACDDATHITVFGCGCYSTGQMECAEGTACRVTDAEGVSFAACE